MDAPATQLFQQDFYQMIDHQLPSRLILGMVYNYYLLHIYVDVSPELVLCNKLDELDCRAER